MTERTGGSDVSMTSTIARPLGGDTYALFGTKWFTSAVTSEMALALARIDDGSGVVDGSKGLTLFCVEIEREAGRGWKGIVCAPPMTPFWSGSRRCWPTIRN